VADTEILNIAIVCHEANRAYCRTLGDHSQPAWGVTPDWQQKSTPAAARTQPPIFAR
jgi:hypothetical protein